MRRFPKWKRARRYVWKFLFAHTANVLGCHSFRGDFRCIFILSPPGVTILAELNSLVCSNQKLLCSLFHKCSAETLLELLENKMYLGVTIGIIQVLHTWGQELNYYPYIHCINILLIPKEL